MTMPQEVAEIMCIFLADGDPLYQAAIFYSYAKEAEGGCIVELGTYRGRGAVALALGTRDGNKLKVYTIDDYVERQGWIGEPYGPDDKETFFENIKTVGLEDDITLLQMDVLEAADAFRRIWKEGISLVLWDVGVSRVRDDFDAWKDYVVPGGIFLLKDAQDYQLGTDKIIEEAETTGEWEITRHQNLITALRKPA